MRLLHTSSWILGALLLMFLLQACGGDNDANKEKPKQAESTQVERGQTDTTSEPAQPKAGQEQAKTQPPEDKSPKAQMPSGPTPVGKLVLVRGKVIVKRHNGNQTLMPAIGDHIYLNDRIITSKDGYARMHMRDDSILRIAPSSELAVTTQLLGPEHSNTTIDLLKGKLRAIVVHKLGAGDSFEVKTSVAVAGVRGTDFEVIAGRQTVVRCYKGVVAINNIDTAVSGKVLLTPRTYTRVAVEAPPVEPLRLSPRVVPLEDPPAPSPTPAKPRQPVAAAQTKPLPAAVPPPAAIPVPEESPAVEPPKQTAPEEKPVTREQADQLYEKSYQASRDKLQHGELQEYWEQKSDQPLHEILYGDGLDGWTVNPAK